MSFIETQANKYASKNMNNFNNVIKKFNIDISLIQTQEYCNNLYINYKKLCKFENIIKIGYLFENNKDLYNNLKYGMINVKDRKDFRDLFLSDLASIYKTVFGKEYTRLSAIEKIEKANDSITKIYNCILHRIQYHFWCKNHHVKYNVKSHEHEILLSLYMYNRIIDVSDLLNIYQDKYKTFKKDLQIKKEKLQIKKQEIIIEEESLDREEEEFDNLTSSHTLSEEPFVFLPKDKKRTSRK